jgi:hypothetical protein
LTLPPLAGIVLKLEPAPAISQEETAAEVAEVEG